MRMSKNGCVCVRIVREGTGERERLEAGQWLQSGLVNSGVA